MALREIITLQCVQAVCCVLSCLDECQLLNSCSPRKTWFSKIRLSLVISAQITILNFNNLDWGLPGRDVAGEQMVAFSIFSKQVDFGSFKSVASSSADQSQKAYGGDLSRNSLCLHLPVRRKRPTTSCVCVLFSPHVLCAVQLAEGAEGQKLEKQL